MSASKSIQLILARQLASCIATPILLVDAQNALIYYNEPAEAIFNQRFDETGEMPAEEWTTRFAAVDDRPQSHSTRRSTHDAGARRGCPISQTMWLRASNGDWQHLRITAIPLIGEKGLLLGAMSIFWAI